MEKNVFKRASTWVITAIVFAVGGIAMLVYKIVKK